MIKSALWLVAGLVLVALTQYSVVQAPYGFNADAFGYLCYYTVMALDHLTVGLHLGGLHGAEVAANSIAVLEVLGIVVFLIWHGARGLISDLPSREEFARFAQRGGPVTGWRSVAGPLALIGALLAILVALGYYAYTDPAPLGSHLVPYAPSWLLLLGIAVCAAGAYAFRPRSS